LSLWRASPKRRTIGLDVPSTWSRAMPDRRLVIAAYDVASQRRLKRALKHCTAYASGGQKSVHECWVTGAERSALSGGLGKICRADAWLLADLGVNPRVIALGLGRPAARPRSVVFLG
jgi:CRISPR-associated protein Cas2